MASIKTILHITPFFRPNIGGVETHLDDLIDGLQSSRYRQIILTYSPLSTVAPYQKVEIHKNIIIRRFYLPGYNLFHRLEKQPLLNFLYITPTLLFCSIFWLLAHRPHINTIHSHGLNAALIGNIIKFLFPIRRHITSIYSTYDNVPLNSLTTKFLVSTLNHTDHVLTQTDQSVKQLISLGVIKQKISRYYHWIDLKRFKPIAKKPSLFTVLFVGRLIPAKNALTLARVALKLTDVNFQFVGTGPDYAKLKIISRKTKNIKLIGDIPYSELHSYYQQSTILCLPSIYQEGWGRVLAESVACGTPVICSNLGGTTEAVDNSVAIILSPTYENIYKAIKKLSTSPRDLAILQNNCQTFAKKHYSLKNIRNITDQY